jgi:hypothetical protein
MASTGLHGVMCTMASTGLHGVVCTMASTGLHGVVCTMASTGLHGVVCTMACHIVLVCMRIQGHVNHQCHSDVLAHSVLLRYESDGPALYVDG